jgi:putative selenium metabolism protein SsnA
LIIKNANIFTFDDNNSNISSGFITIKNGIIDKIGSMSELIEANIAEHKDIIDAKGKIVFPGFICTHTHIYSAFARGMVLDGYTPSNFIEILNGLWWRLDKKLELQDIYYSALVTLVEAIKSGVTCLFDHHASPFAVDGSLDVIEKAFNELGVRGTLCYEVSDRDGLEISRQGIRENVRFVKKQKLGDMVKGLFGLHASFTLSNETLMLASEEGNLLGCGFHIHAAEGIEDYEHSRRNFGEGVIERLEDFSILSRKTILAHCIHIKEEEIDILKKVNVVHNPESNMNNAVGYCDALKLMNKGVLLGLGSDGFSSNPFRAIECCYVLHKHEMSDPRVMTPHDVINLAVKNNSRIASRFFDNAVGVIKAGAKADLIFIDYDAPTPINSSNIFGHIVFGMSDGFVTDSIINGKVVMKDRLLQCIEEQDIFAKSRELAQSLWNRI